jgi:hypothetical protein
MNEQQWTFIDRSEWPAGEWDNEPDKVQWTDEATGLVCLLHRSEFGHWCGYVGLPPSHPLYERSYEDIYENVANLGVHGGVTYSEACAPDHDPVTGRGVCHVPEPGEPDNLWWIGFDCGHAHDASPGMLKYSALVPIQLFGKVYRKMAYAKEQTRALAQQLHAIA